MGRKLLSWTLNRPMKSIYARPRFVASIGDGVENTQNSSLYSRTFIC